MIPKLKKGMSTSAALATVAAAGIIGHATFSLACSATGIVAFTQAPCRVYDTGQTSCSATGLTTGVTWQWCCPFGCGCGTGVHDGYLNGVLFINPTAQPLCVPLD